jgi:hypothetical protein
LLGEALIVMPVTAQDDISPGCIKRYPEVAQVGVTAVGTEQGLVMDGQDTRVRVRSQISLKPLSLGRIGLTAANLRTFRIEGNDMPGADVIAVIAFRRVARGGAKVIEIA